jgi:myo-inositol-1(or 4)-monophosphatase
MSTPSHDLPSLHAFAAHLAILAGSYLRDQALSRTQGGGRSFDESITIKENAADLVTHADMHAEQLISDAIRDKYPEHK